MGSLSITRVAAVSLTFLLGGCAGLTAAMPLPTVTVTAEAPSPTPTPPPTASSVVPVRSAGVSASAGGVIVVPVGSERTLHLVDAQPTSKWREAGFQPVGSSGAQQAIGAVVTCWSGGNPEPLEFRFAQNSGTFEATVAQDMGAKSSSEQLEWTLTVDGRPQEVKRIFFKESATFTTPLAGVAVVQLSTKISSDKCKDATTALVTSVTIKG